MVRAINQCHKYKFIVVYCESVNLISYITIDYLLMVYGIKYSCTRDYSRDCTRDPFSTCISTHGAPRLNLM